MLPPKPPRVKKRYPRYVLTYAQDDAIRWLYKHDGLAVIRTRIITKERIKTYVTPIAKEHISCYVQTRVFYSLQLSGHALIANDIITITPKGKNYVESTQPKATDPRRTESSGRGASR